MREIVDTLARIAELEPPELPAISLGPLPDFQAARPLADMIAQDSDGGARLIEVASAVTADRGKIDDLVGTASSLVGAARESLLGLAGELVRQALPLLPGLISPVPGARAASITQLTHLGQTFLQAAIEKIAGLTSELEPLTADLEQISQTSHSEQLRAADMTAPPQETPTPETPETQDEPGDAPSGAGEAAVAAALSDAWDGKFFINAEFNVLDSGLPDQNHANQLHADAGAQFPMGAFPQMGYLIGRAATEALLSIEGEITKESVNQAFHDLQGVESDMWCKPWYFSLDLGTGNVSNNTDRTVVPMDGNMVEFEECFDILATDNNPLQAIRDAEIAAGLR